MPSFLQAPTTSGPGTIPPPAPPAPNADIAPGPGGVTQWRVPRTPSEQAILQAQREALSGQIINVRDRRNSIAASYERASGANRAGLEQQLRVLDDRLLQLEQDLAESGRALYQSNVVSTSTGVVPRQFFNISSGQMTGISIVFILFVLGPLAASLGRLMWRRSTKPAMPPGWYDAAQRLERLEQAVDTVAVEVERVSEGQRFMTKIMTQNAAAATNGAATAGVNGAQPLPALGPGAPPDPIVLQNQRDEVRLRRS